MNQEKYIDGFCFSNFYISESGEEIFYCWQKAGRKELYRCHTNTKSFNNGSKVIEFDFSQGSFAIEHYDEKRKQLYIVLDTDNKENYNLWKINVSKGELKQLTTFGCTYGSTFNEDASLCWCYDKQKLPDGTFNSSVYELDLINHKQKFLFSDTGQDYRIAWTLISPIIGTDQFLFGVDYLSQRKQTNICLYSLTDKKWNKLLPESLELAGNPTLEDKNPGAEGFYFQSLHEGFENIYFFSFADRSIKKVTHLNQKNEVLRLIDRNGGKEVFSVIKKENKYFLDILNKDKHINSLSFSSLLFPYRTKKDLWFYMLPPHAIGKITKINSEGQVLQSIDITSLPAEELSHTKTSWVSYSSFDGKEIKALLHLPKNELKAVSVVAFYGGEEYYDIIAQRYAELGIATLSPAVRGSWGWGKEWEKLLEGDLGGDEILDVIWAGKFLQKHLNLPPDKIGVHGGSHGGFATLRAITMPKNYKGLSETFFPFGFAVCNVGFADLVAFYKDSRIADWLVHLLGPFDEAKYLERSPLTHFENLRTPLLIINGKNDSRVPFSTMEGFIEKLKVSDKDYELLIHETQGHGTSNRETTLLEYDVEIKFLKKYLG